MSPRSTEIVIVREGLKSGRFRDRHTSTLRLVIVNEVVPVFRDVAGDCCRRTICHLNTEPVVKVPFAQGVEVFVVRIKLGREIAPGAQKLFDQLKQYSLDIPCEDGQGFRRRLLKLTGNTA